MSEQKWQLLEEELDTWCRQENRCRLWWRDDDLIAYTPALSLMHSLAEEFNIDVLVAVIPSQMSQNLGRDTSGMYRFGFCQHGFSHHNHSVQGLANNEYPLSRDRTEVEMEIFSGHQMLKQQFGQRLLPFFVPPWNRYPTEFASALHGVGCAAISQYGQHDCRNFDGLLRIDTHIDIVDWSNAPRFLPAHESTLLGVLIESLRQQRLLDVKFSNPLGVLTHHRAMDGEAWRFMRRLFRLTRRMPCVDWLSPHAWLVVRE